jgi:pyruvate dehydrogenase (quinone)
MAKKDRMNTADIIVEGLIAWGVDTVFGIPGDGINGVMEALRTRQDRIRFVHTRHEEGAAFMACAHAKYTGRLGVCLATSGPGAIHLLNGLYDAKLDGAPVLAITGQTYHDLIGMHYQQEVDLLALFADVTVYNQRVMSAAHAHSLVDVACRSALAGPGVAHLTCPVDLQEQTLDAAHRSKKNVDGHTSTVWTRPRMVPPHPELAAAAEALGRGRKTAILAGRGALEAGALLEQVAERLAAPIIKPLLGKAVVPDDSPYTTGGIGVLGTAPSQDALEACDTLLIVGSSFPYMEYYPKPGQAVAVQIDAQPARIGLRYPVEHGLAGDAVATLEALLPLLPQREDRSFLETAQRGMAAWNEKMVERGTRDEEPLKPQVVAHELSQLLADDAIISADSGTNTVWAARHIRIRRGQMFSCSGNLATMAPGLPYTIAAQLAFPDRQCVAFVGDGGFEMLMAEFATAVKYDLPITVVIIRNDMLGMIKWEQMTMLGNPEYGVQLTPIDFVGFAQNCGGVGVRCSTRAEVRPTLEAALRSGRPAIVEAVVDPNEPPMPPKTELKQMLHMAEALVRGEPHRGRIALTLFRDKLDDLL